MKLKLRLRAAGYCSWECLKDDRMFNDTGNDERDQLKMVNAIEEQPFSKIPCISLFV
jgi:hypothetical protein